MKKKHLLLIGFGLLSFVTIPTLGQQVITVETFGDTGYDTDGSHTNGSNNYYYWDEVTTWTSTNGQIEGGQQKSVRLNSYLAQTELQDYENASQSMAICLHPSSRYTDAIWSEISFVDIDISGYTDLVIGFGFAKRNASWVGDANVRGLGVEYSIDGGDWIDLDATVISNPLEINTWEWEEISISATGESLSVRFTSTDDNDIMLDDITVLGTGTSTDLADEYSVKEIGDVLVYPNPIKDNFTIKTEQELGATFEIISLSGTVVMHGDLLKGTKSLNLSSLDAGIYIIAIMCEGRKHVQRIIKE